MVGLQYLEFINKYYLTSASIKAVAYELQLLDKSYSCRKLNNMKESLVL